MSSEPMPAIPVPSTGRWRVGLASAAEEEDDERFGMPDYVNPGRYYEIWAGDEQALDAYITDISNLGDRFAFEVVMA